MNLRAAAPDDVPVLLVLIGDLAEYERARDEVAATEQLLTEALFGDDHVAHCEVAEIDGAVVGLALWYRSFSTWTGRTGLYLEDLYVRPEHRGAGAGRALLARLAQICVDRGWSRLEWSVLDWNEPAIGFYRSIGAAPLDEWTVNRLAGSPLRELAAPNR
ncbi:MAG TPA: GNAT family N-acetyltransferase [Mycobacteriales bacterium]